MAPKIRLFVRLSSLGDVILATAALPEVSESWQNHFVVRKEFVPLLSGHPRIQKIIAFDRRTGLKGWLHLGSQLKSANYTEVYDLHRSLRTWLWKWILGFRAKTISKERWKLWGYFVFKKFWPRKLRPTPWVQKYKELVVGARGAGVDFRYLLGPGNSSQGDKVPGLMSLMPSSKWKSKEWPLNSWLELASDMLKAPGLSLVVLGTSSDECSQKLFEKLNVLFPGRITSALDRPWSEVAGWIARSQICLGVDTGILHLSEGLGTRNVVLYGPTRPDQGFGPSQESSLAITQDVFCAPCGKDGRFCYRIWEPYACLRKLKPHSVIEALRKNETKNSTHSL